MLEARLIKVDQIQILSADIRKWNLNWGTLD